MATDTGYAEWQQAVAKVLAKARRTDVSELPADPESLLAVTTYDDVTIAPLYTEADERPEAPLPGRYPFVRGSATDRDVQRGWHVTARFAGADGAAVNREILDALNNGVSAIWLAVEPGVVGPALDGVLLDLAPVTLDAGAHTPEAAARLLELAAGQVDAVLGLGAAPLTDEFAGRPRVDVAAVVALARQAAGHAATVRAVVVDGTVFNDAGSSDAQELGAAAAAGLDYLRALTGAGLTIGQALDQLEFRFAATDDQFQTIAKFRAARRIWARVAQVCGASDFGGAPQHAVTSAAMLTQRDPWVNLLRTTLAAFGAGVGGADQVTVGAFDAALAPGALGVSEAFSARMARNIQELLLAESHLGRVFDPAAGSWYVDDLTEAIAGRAWEFFQRIVAAGGYRAALNSGLIADEIAVVRDRRADDVAHRRTSVTGVNEFPNLAEPPVADASPLAAVHRYAAAFEALRDRSDAYLAAHGVRPRAVLIPIGPVAEHTARLTFATNLLASGGIEAVQQDADGAAIAVLCGSDARYADEAGATVAGLRAKGVGTVLLAGPERAVGDSGGRPDGYLTSKIDAVAALSDLLTKVGA